MSLGLYPQEFLDSLTGEEAMFFMEMVGLGAYDDMPKEELFKLPLYRSIEAKLNNSLEKGE